MRLKQSTASKTNRTSDTTSDSKPDISNQSPVYGDPESSRGSRRHTIICDGRIIKVTSNLKDALRMLAGSATSRSMGPNYYWIDALCMDQQNVLERNAQVAKMAEIFRKAQSVIVWLGKEDEYTVDALTTIEKVSAIPEEAWLSVSYTSFYDPTQASAYPPPNLSYQNWLGFIALINRPWFKRAWASPQSPPLDSC
jgi:hypothetical protein